MFVGAGGVGQAREGISVTPAGTYPLTGAFGRQANPGTTMPYFQTDVQDWWDENPASPTYNTHVRQAASPGGASENLYRAGAVYDYAVVIGYNPGRVPGAGSGIFLHVSNGTPTAGCVSMDGARLTDLLRWLRPAAQPYMMIDVAHVVNAIADAWYRVGGAAGALGLPTTDERGLGDGRGISQWFQHGAVYWTGATGAHPVVNADLQAWAMSGYERGPLGYPSTDEWGLPDGRGITQWFEHGAVYWSAATGAHRMTGAILQNWVDRATGRPPRLPGHRRVGAAGPPRHLPVVRARRGLLDRRHRRAPPDRRHPAGVGRAGLRGRGPGLPDQRSAPDVRRRDPGGLPARLAHPGAGRRRALTTGGRAAGGRQPPQVTVSWMRPIRPVSPSRSVPTWRVLPVTR